VGPQAGSTGPRAGDRRGLREAERQLWRRPRERTRASRRWKWPGNLAANLALRLTRCLKMLQPSCSQEWLALAMK
jgi:hypothetical protein